MLRNELSSASVSNSSKKYDICDAKLAIILVFTVFNQVAKVLSYFFIVGLKHKSSPLR